MQSQTCQKAFLMRNNILTTSEKKGKCMYLRKAYAMSFSNMDDLHRTNSDAISK